VCSRLPYLSYLSYRPTQLTVCSEKVGHFHVSCTFYSFKTKTIVTYVLNLMALWTLLIRLVNYAKSVLLRSEGWLFYMYQSNPQSTRPSDAADWLIQPLNASLYYSMLLFSSRCTYSPTAGYNTCITDLPFCVPFISPIPHLAVLRCGFSVSISEVWLNNVAQWVWKQSVMSILCSSNSQPREYVQTHMQLICEKID